MFDDLNAGFECHIDFEAPQDRGFPLRKFLTRFDAIFSLNQDLLLELQYRDSVFLSSNTRWAGLDIPGVVPVGNPSLIDIGDKHRRQWKPEPPPYRMDSRSQPYFKLHGSTNWYTSDGRKLLVMGGNKDAMIREHTVLAWYYKTFNWYLSQPNTRIMVIGYSFSDQHINNAIIEASNQGTMTGMFLVDPAGRAILNPDRHLPMRRHSELEDIGNLGTSIRPIVETFAGDHFEHEKLIGFFQP
jgi:hypothetical protein